MTQSRVRLAWSALALAVLLTLPLAFSLALLATGVVLALRRRRALAAELTGGAGEGTGVLGGRGLRAPGAPIRLGRDRSGRSVTLSDEQLAAHGLILGASGAGKSTTLLSILTARISQGAPVVAIDLKGSPGFAGALAAAAAGAGRRCLVWTPDGPLSWNPLAHGNPTELKDKLIASERFSEPHYQRAAERYLQLAIGVMQEREPERPVTLEQVVRLLDPARLGALIRGLPGARAEYLSDYLATLTGDQLSAIRGLGTRLALLTESEAGRFLGTGSAKGAGSAAGALAAIDLSRALEQREVVLFSLNSGRYGKLAAQLGTLAVQDLIAVAGRRLETTADTQAPRAVVAIDEFSALGADQILALFARARGSRISVLVATQELADLDRAAPGLRDQILGNTALKIAHRQDVPGSAQTIAQMAGTRMRWEVTQRTGPPWPGLAGANGAFGGTRRETEEFVVHPNEIKRLRTGEAVMITKLPRAEVRTVRIARHPTPAPPPRSPGGRER